MSSGIRSPGRPFSAEPGPILWAIPPAIDLPSAVREEYCLDNRVEAILPTLPSFAPPSSASSDPYVLPPLVACAEGDANGEAN